MNGDGVYNDGSSSTFNSIDTSVNYITASNDGGGIYNNGGTVTLTNSVSVNYNSAARPLGSGGGIFSTVDLSIPSGDVKNSQPDNIVQP